MNTNFDSKKQVQKALNSSHILPDLLNTIITLSSKSQLEYIGFLEKLVDKFRELLNDQIESIDLNHQLMWSNVNSKKFGFIDGGMASINSLGSEPIAVRVGRYTVVPGMTGINREGFNFTTQLVDELYDIKGNQAIYEEINEDNSKLRDMARIISEAGSVYKSLINENDYNFLYLHGPLVNPVAPYSIYPSFTNKILDVLQISRKDIHELVKTKISKSDEMHFISVYYYILNYLYHTNTPILGIIERNSNSRVVSFSILNELEEENSIQAKEARLWKENMMEYRVTDAILFSCLLKSGEYIRPLPINKNGIHKSPDMWKPVIKDFPMPVTTYLRVSETSFPFRVEMYPADKSISDLMTNTYHMARLLPQYGFPVGLDIVDKYAKVPRWMSKQISKEHSMNLLKGAIGTGRTDVINMVKLHLSGNKRDWLFRPKSY